VRSGNGVYVRPQEEEIDEDVDDLGDRGESVRLSGKVRLQAHLEDDAVRPAFCHGGEKRDEC